MYQQLVGSGGVVVPLLTFWSHPKKPGGWGFEPSPRPLPDYMLTPGISATTIETWEIVGLGRMHWTLGEISWVLQGL